MWVIPSEPLSKLETFSLNIPRNFQYIFQHEHCLTPLQLIRIRKWYGAMLLSRRFQARLVSCPIAVPSPSDHGPRPGSQLHTRILSPWCPAHLEPFLPASSSSLTLIREGHRPGLPWNVPPQQMRPGAPALPLGTQRRLQGARGMPARLCRGAPGCCRLQPPVRPDGPENGLLTPNPVCPPRLP